MGIFITSHARSRMEEYGITEEMVLSCLYHPDSVLVGLGERRIAQQRLNSLVLRVIFEENNGEIIVITTYKARANRYEL